MTTPADVIRAERAANDVAPAKDDRTGTPMRVESSEVDLFSKLIVSVEKIRDEERYKIQPISANVSTILHMHRDWSGVLRFDAHAGKIVTARVPPWHELDAPANAQPGQWTDADTTRLVHWLERTSVAGCEPLHIRDRATVANAVVVAAERNAVHPVREYLRGLTWDGVPRVEMLASRYFGADDSDYVRSVSACLLIGAVARVMAPGCKLDTLPILEGRQGSGKSTALGILGGAWYTDSKIDIGSKDAYQALRGVWLVELGELAALRRANVESVKAFVSSAVDRYRPSYGRFEVEVPRQCVFVGTTNGSEYLHDETGARRFHPVKTGTINLDALRRDRNQLWAEAVARFDAGEPWHVRGELVRVAAAEAEGRYATDPWEDIVRAYTAVRATVGVTVAEVLDRLCVETGRRTRSDAMRVGSILRRLGWEPRQQRTDGARERRYFPREGEP